MNFLVKQNDKALREALRQQSEQHMRLPSNFAYTTMRRIERERQTEEKREKLAAVITIAACCLLGVGTMAYFCSLPCLIPICVKSLLHKI